MKFDINNKMNSSKMIKIQKVIIFDHEQTNKKIIIRGLSIKVLLLIKVTFIDKGHFYR